MKNIMNQKGFTLIEMLIVLLIISVLILITVPNLTKHNDTVDEKGCEHIKKLFLHKSNYINWKIKNFRRLTNLSTVLTLNNLLVRMVLHYPSTKRRRSKQK